MFLAEKLLDGTLILALFNLVFYLPYLKILKKKMASDVIIVGFMKIVVFIITISVLVIYFIIIWIPQYNVHSIIYHHTIK